MAPTAFIGGKLKLKGDKDSSKKTKKKKSKSSKHSIKAIEEARHRSVESEEDNKSEDGMTEAERRASKFKLECQKRDLEKISEMSHRERVELFNENLSTLTELNDIPRVSAAGNG